MSHRPGRLRRVPHRRAPLRALRRALALTLLPALTGCGLPEAQPRASTPVEGSVPVPGDAQAAVVVRITDGDTVVLRGRGTGSLGGAPTRVRVLLVDTPEITGDGQCLGPEATARTEQLLPIGAVVHVQADEDPHDRYGRALLHVWDPDGVNLGEALLHEGLATVLQVSPNRRYLEQFEAAQRTAQDAGRGLWSACAPG